MSDIVIRKDIEYWGAKKQTKCVLRFPKDVLVALEWIDGFKLNYKVGVELYPDPIKNQIVVKMPGKGIGFSRYLLNLNNQSYARNKKLYEKQLSKGLSREGRSMLYWNKDEKGGFDLWVNTDDGGYYILQNELMYIENLKETQNKYPKDKYHSMNEAFKKLIDTHTHFSKVFLNHLIEYGGKLPSNLSKNTRDFIEFQKQGVDQKK